MGFQIIFEQAISFDICARLCKKELNKCPGKNEQFLIPMVTNFAFACELYIKTLIDYNNQEIPKSHFLNELYDALPVEERTIIENKWAIHSSEIGRSFADLLNSNKNAFCDLRYCYEQKEMLCNKYFFDKFSSILKEVCCQKIYEMNWESYCSIVEIDNSLWG